ncbi:hypothetical protein WA556_005082 [Blastocystis sp. ATCC 50177/Nand II]
MNQKRTFISYSQIIFIVSVLLGFGFCKKQYLSTLMCLCFYLLSEFYELSGTYISFNRTPSGCLPDYGFEVVKEEQELDVPFIGKTKTETVINTLLFSLLFSALFFLLRQHDNLLLLRRVFFMLGLTALLRPMIFCMTSLPDPSHWNPNRSDKKQKQGVYSLGEIINYTFTRLKNPSNIDTSGDMLFSGHTRYLCTAVCAYASMITAENASLYIPLFLVALTAALYTCFLIVKCRFHYSVDIFMAVLVVVCLWLIINESAVLAELSPDVTKLPYICRGLISFMRWLNM